MTKKEAKIILQCRGNGYSEDEFNEALEIAYTALDCSLPDNLDEAAKEYMKKARKHLFDDSPIGRADDAFKAGAEWMAKQMNNDKRKDN